MVDSCTKKGSGDQALEQCYNQPAKVSGGIIGVTRKNNAVALWGIIKHKKDQYVDLLKNKNDIREELSLIMTSNRVQLLQSLVWYET